MTEFEKRLLKILDHEHSRALCKREIIQLIETDLIGEDEEGPIEIPDLPGLKLDDLETFIINKHNNKLRQKLGK